jgi:6-pyruvoyltetrahydropterin/6-carboxytetrahydropterin synthase
MLFLSVESHFDSAHYLMSYQGPCQRMHGHRWLVKVYVGPFSEARISGNNMIVDFKDLKRSVDMLTSQLDHQILNEVLKVSDPTAEFLVLWFVKALREAKIKPAKVDLYESPDSCVTWLDDGSKL